MILSYAENSRKLTNENNIKIYIYISSFAEKDLDCVGSVSVINGSLAGRRPFSGS